MLCVAWNHEQALLQLAFDVAVAQQAGPMVHGEHVHLVLSDPVNDSVAMETDFANGLALNLWDDSAQLGVRG